MLVFLYPSQLKMAEKAGWLRGKHYEVYKCLKCFRPMDACACPTTDYQLFDYTRTTP